MISILNRIVECNALLRKHARQIGDEAVCAKNQRRVVKVFYAAVNWNPHARAKKVYHNMHVSPFQHAIDESPFDKGPNRFNPHHTAGQTIS
jgi:hypothetical protein